MEEAKVSCVVSEVTFRSTWVWGLVARTNHLVRALECSVPPPWPPQRGGGWRLSSTTSSQWFNQLCLCNEVSIKTWKDGVQRVSSGWALWALGRLIHRKGYGSSKLLSTYLTLCISSFGCSSISFMIPFMINWQTSVNISEFFSEFCKSVQQINWTQGGCCRTL